MKKVIVFILIGILLTADVFSLIESSLFAAERPRKPKDYAPVYYTPVIRVQPEITHIPNSGTYTRLITVLEGYKVARKPYVEVKMDRERIIRNPVPLPRPIQPLIRKKRSFFGLKRRDKIIGWEQRVPRPIQPQPSIQPGIIRYIYYIPIIRKKRSFFGLKRRDKIIGWEQRVVSVPSYSIQPGTVKTIHYTPIIRKKRSFFGLKRKIRIIGWRRLF